MAHQQNRQQGGGGNKPPKKNLCPQCPSKGRSQAKELPRLDGGKLRLACYECVPNLYLSASLLKHDSTTCLVGFAALVSEEGGPYEDYGRIKVLVSGAVLKDPATQLATSDAGELRIELVPHKEQREIIFHLHGQFPINFPFTIPGYGSPSAKPVKEPKEWDTPSIEVDVEQRKGGIQWVVVQTNIKQGKVQTKVPFRLHVEGENPVIVGLDHKGWKSDGLFEYKLKPSGKQRKVVADLLVATAQTQEKKIPAIVPRFVPTVPNPNLSPLRNLVRALKGEQS